MTEAPTRTMMTDRDLIRNDRIFIGLTPAERRRHFGMLRTHLDFPPLDSEGRRCMEDIIAYIDRRRVPTKMPPFRPRGQMRDRKDSAYNLGISIPHFDLLVESREFPAGRQWGKMGLAWDDDDLAWRFGIIGVVYFLEINAEFIKIGFSSALYWRMTSLATMIPYDLTLLLNIRASKPVEQLLHRKFDDIRHRGEWFERTRELLAYIESLRVPK